MKLKLRLVRCLNAHVGSLRTHEGSPATEGFRDGGSFRSTGSIIGNEVLQARQVEQVVGPEGIVGLAVVIKHDLRLVGDEECFEIQTISLPTVVTTPSDGGITTGCLHWPVGSRVAALTQKVILLNC